jgi:hypothetical protein
VVATLEDYRAVHALVAGSMAESLEQTVPAAIQSTVTVVRELNEPLSNSGIALSVIAKHLGIDKSSASRRCRAAQPYIRNLETRRGAPARFVPGEPLPHDQPVLPDVSKLEAALHRCTHAEGRTGHPPALPGESLESDLPPMDDPPAETRP